MKYFATLSDAMAFLLDVSLMLSILLTLPTPSFLISTISRSILLLFSSHPRSDRENQYSHHDTTRCSSRFRFLWSLRGYETIAREKEQRDPTKVKYLSSNWPSFPEYVSRWMVDFVDSSQVYQSCRRQWSWFIRARLTACKLGQRRVETCRFKQAG
jgi:hypothetical protein